MKRLCTAGLILALLATAAIAQGRGGGGSVTGTVLCEDTKAPARRAYVWLQAPIKNEPGVFVPPREASLGAETDLNGAFTIANVMPGEYYIVATYPGYISAQEYIFPGTLSPEATGSRQPPPSFVQRVTIAAGDTVHAQIRLKKGGAISGTAAYSDGAPVPYIALNAVIKINGEFGRVPNLAHADSSGNYRIDGLADGTYTVMGAIAGSEVVTVFGGGKSGGSGLLTFAGGGMRASKARLVAVTSPNEYKGVNVTIPLVGGHEVAGMVTAPDGHRLNYGLVRIHPTGETVISLATPLTADGAFSFRGIPADSYTISVEDASDFKLIPVTGGIVPYQQPTLVRKYGPGSVDVNVTDRDVTDVSFAASAIR